MTNFNGDVIVNKIGIVPLDAFHVKYKQGEGAKNTEFKDRLEATIKRNLEVLGYGE